MIGELLFAHKQKDKTLLGNHNLRDQKNYAWLIHNINIHYLNI